MKVLKIKMKSTLLPAMTIQAELISCDANDSWSCDLDIVECYMCCG